MNLLDVMFEGDADSCFGEVVNQLMVPLKEMVHN